MFHNNITHHGILQVGSSKTYRLTVYKYFSFIKILQQLKAKPTNVTNVYMASHHRITSGYTYNESQQCSRCTNAEYFIQIYIYIHTYSELCECIYADTYLFRRGRYSTSIQSTELPKRIADYAILKMNVVDVGIFH